jgi:glutamine cyclotransferase
MSRKLRLWLIFALLLALTLPLRSPHAQRQPERLRVQIHSVRPHDPSAFTQGLLIHDGFFYESTGLYGQSTLRKVDMQTGEVLQQLSLPAEFFAEGLALVGERLIQLTWREQVAFVYDLETFEQRETFTYIGEGWGLCYDQETDELYMSNGSHVLYVRDPETFSAVRQLEIVLDDVPIRNLNELECVGDSIYANIWFSDQILRIDKQTGRITAIIDASNLLTPEEREAIGRAGTLNGIAYDAETERFFLTGKLWQWIFEVDFVPELPENYVTPTPLAR